MGLDLFLVKIEDKEIDDQNWLLASENPELESKFASFKREKHFQYEDEDYYDTVYYYSDISYQRKGVSTEFYTKTENDKCILEKSELEKLLPYIDKKYKQNFQLNFIDNFIDSKTVLIVSW